MGERHTYDRPDSHTIAVAPPAIFRGTLREQPRELEAHGKGRNPLARRQPMLRHGFEFHRFQLARATGGCQCR